MEEFIHLGEVVGGLNALMVLKEEIPINQRQCILLFEIITSSFQTISEKIRQNLLLESKSTKWRPLIHPLNQLVKVFKECETYIRSCLDFKSFLGRAVALHHNNDSVEFHVHNLLSIFPSVLESVDLARDPSSLPADHPLLHLNPDLFLSTLGHHYLVPKSTTRRLDASVKEDRWLLSESLKDRKRVAKSPDGILSSLLRNLEDDNFENPLFPTSAILDSKHFSVRRRLGSSGRYREVELAGESFVLRKFSGGADALSAEVRALLSLSHPNITRCLLAFREQDEFLVLLEPMKMELSKCIREKCNSRKEAPFAVPVAVDLMLQVARGMEYLHSCGLCHTRFSHSSVLVRPRPGGFLLAKVSGFGLPSLSESADPPPSSGPASVLDLDRSFIWRAPEVMAGADFTEKSDVYSFGMVFFEVVTGKVAFEEGHLKGEKMVRNIKAGERPLFPSSVPNYLVSLIKRCWHQDPTFRPTFASLARILRYVGRFRPEDELPRADFYDLDAGFLERDERGLNLVSHIPFQMLLFQALERNRTRVGRDDRSDSYSEPTMMGSRFGDEYLESDRRSVCSDIVLEKSEKKKVGTRSSGGTPRSQQSKRSPLQACNSGSGCSGQMRRTSRRSSCSPLS